MKTSSAKAKGRRAAQEVKKLMLQYCMDLQEDDLGVTTSGDTGEDIKMSPKAREYYPFAIEVKNVEKLNIWDALEQARSHSDIYAPLLFFKRNNTELKVALDATTFLAMITTINDAKQSYVKIEGDSSSGGYISVDRKTALKKNWDMIKRIDRPGNKDEKDEK